MKVHFEFTAKDLAELSERTLGRSRVIQGARLEARLFWAAIVGLLVFALCPGEVLPRAAFSALFAGGLFALMPIFNRGSSSSNTLKYYREQLGGDGPFVCEVELSPAALITRQLGVESKHPWSHVGSISDGPDGIEITYKPMGELLVRSRAFPNLEVRQQFLTLAQKYGATS
jgi:hypothetical protein